MTNVVYPHISLDKDGDPSILSANTKVILIAMDRLAHHWDADEIQRQRPHLSLGQIYAALAYYYDHENEINGQIQKRLNRESDLLAELGPSRARTKIEAMKRAS